MKKIIILGGHGDGLVAAQIIKDMQQSGLEVELAGFLNDHLQLGDTIENIPVLGKTSEWSFLDVEKKYYFYPALHKIKQMPQRKILLINLGIPSERLFSPVHPTATVASSAQIEHGCLIASHVTVQPGARIASYSSIRAGANIGHDAHIEGFCYVGPNATMTGKSILREGAHLGPNAVIVDGITLETYAIAGAGSVILKDTMPNSLYIGNPARKIMELYN